MDNPWARPDTGPMADEADDWRDRVQAAAQAGDETALRALFDEARRIFGDAAGEQWARTLSALDGTAVTG